MNHDAWVHLGAYAAGLVLTLTLAAHLTPSRWWRRLNAGALAITVGGTWALGALILWLPLHSSQLLAQAAAGLQSVAHAETVAPAQAAALPEAAATRPALIAGRHYRVYQDVNLRAGTSIDAKRLAVLPEGADVTATGQRDGDWWQITASVSGHALTGWTSSLWLRRLDEGAAD